MTIMQIEEQKIFDLRKFIANEVTLNYPKKVFLGINIDDEDVYLSSPSWEYNRYWGFGYIGNKDHHYHLDSLENNKQCIYYGIKNHFKSFVITENSDIWEFSELITLFYRFKNISEIYKRGHANLISTIMIPEVKNIDEYVKINSIILPSIFKEIYNILNKYK